MEIDSVELANTTTHIALEERGVAFISAKRLQLALEAFFWAIVLAAVSFGAWKLFKKKD